MEAMYEKYGDDVAFFLVYIREAHPNKDLPQTTTVDQRANHAKEMCSDLDISIPTLIDKADNKVGSQYAGFPDRLYLIDPAGKIAYKGAKGPHGFHPDELESAIKKQLKK